MHGLFIASGSRLVSGVVVPPFENVHVYDLMCALLEIAPAPNDGDRRVIGNVLR
jgi:ectonucleotide pyrophosphatase/phosphodiesterase family protein 7